MMNPPPRLLEKRPRLVSFLISHFRANKEPVFRTQVLLDFRETQWYTLHIPEQGYQGKGKTLA